MGAHGMYDLAYSKCMHGIYDRTYRHVGTYGIYMNYTHSIGAHDIYDLTHSVYAHMAYMALD